MTTCSKCGHEGAGAFCGNCGADLRGQDDATGTVGTQQSAEHREGWQDEATYTGYQSYPSRTSGNPRQSAYRSASVGSAPASPNKNRRGNQMLGALVGVAAIAVFALVAYLFLRPGNGNSNAAPSVSNSSVATSSKSSSSSSSSSSASSSSGGQQPQQTVTETATAPADGDDGSGGSSGSGGNGRDSTSMGGYAYQQSGDSVTIMRGSQQVGFLHLNGYRSDWGEGQRLSWNQLNGCSAPILVWNAGKANASAAFGVDGSGHYQMLQSNGNDLAPVGGDGSSAHSYGVYDKGDHIAYADSRADYHSSEHDFNSCDGDGTSLSFSGTSSS